MSDVFAFFFECFFTFNDIVLDLVFVVTCYTLGFINGFTFFLTGTFTDQGSVTEFDGFITGGFLVFDETRLGEGLFTFFLLLGLKISGVGSVALFTVLGMYTFNL